MNLILKLVDFVTTEFLFLMYRGVMWLKARRDTLPWYVKIPGYLFVVVGYVLDVAYNWTVGTGQFRDLPREFTYTSRLKRYKYTHPVGSWRWNRALQICARLDPYDPSGEHC
jgi:hypothetical protein